MNSLNIHDANDMQSHKLGEAMFDEDNMFSPPSFVGERSRNSKKFSYVSPRSIYGETSNE